MKKKTFPQAFLFECAYEKTDLPECKFNKDKNWLQDYRVPLNLFDTLYQPSVRFAKISDLNLTIAAEPDWNHFLRVIQPFEQIVFIRERVVSLNPIVKAYEEKQLRAYIARAKEQKKAAYWLDSELKREAGDGSKN